MDYIAYALVIGVGATAVMDLWAIIRKSALGIAPPNYGFVGRWIAYMPRGHFRHESIAAATSIPGERVIGWAAHYLIGITFAALLIGIWGNDWVRQPTIGPALIVGIGTIAAPFLLMQPGMGAGIAASHTARPNAARVQSLITHLVFGLGLYATARIVQLFVQKIP